MKREDLEALWAETCDLSADDPSLTLSRMPPAAGSAMMIATTRAEPTRGSLLSVIVQRHEAATIDLSAKTVHGLANAGIATVGASVVPPAGASETANVAFAPTSKIVADDVDVGAATYFAEAAHDGVVADGADAATDVGADTLFAEPGSPIGQPSMASAPPIQADADVSAETYFADDGRVTAPTVMGAAGGDGRGAVFELIEPIGEGGMGIVWRARQGSLDRLVAVKAIRREVDTAAARAQFIAEAVVTGGLDHPNVVPVHELGQSADGGVFLAMKLVDGQAWNDLLHPRSDAARAAAEGFDLRRHLDVLTQVTNAVAFAHSRGVVHRDLKPANVMVGAFGEVVVMDWGIAVDVRMPRPAQPRGTHKLDVRGPAGTPAYMAPELATGRGVEISEATDVYLLGAILNEIATGHAPHQGRSLGDVLLAAARSEPPHWPEEAPRALHEICVRAMALDPKDRYPSADAFKEALREYLEHADSLRLSDEADALVERLRNHDRILRHERYGLWAKAQARYVQALELWPGNEGASLASAEVALAIAEEALGRGELGLAAAQVPELGSLLAAHDARAVSVAAAIDRSQGRRRNARWMTAVAVVVLGVVGLVGADLAQRNAHAAAAAAAATLQAKTLRSGWEAIAAGKLADVTSAIDRLRPAHATATAIAPAAAHTGSDTGSTEHPIEALRTGYAVALWQHGLWRTLFDELCPTAGHTPGTRTMRGAIRSAVAVQNTALVAALDDGGARAGADRGELCNVVADAVEAGVPVAAGLAALSVIEAASVADAHDADLRAALRRGALCGLGDGVRCAEVATHFEAVVPGEVLQPPQLSRTTSGAWQATSRIDGAPLWRGPPPPKEQGSAINLPLSDGSILFAEGPYLMRRDGATGRLLARVALPGLALQVWPVLSDRARIAVALWGGRERGSVVRIDLDPEWPQAPAWTADGAARWMMPRPALVAMADEALAEAARTLHISHARACVDGKAWVVATLLIHDMIARERDDFEAQLAALEGADAAVRAEYGEVIADAIVMRTSALAPLAQAVVAARLDALGFEKHADIALARALDVSVRANANVDLDVLPAGTASAAIRDAAAHAWRDGRENRALALLRTSLRFGSTRPGDRMVAAQAASWYAAHSLALPADLAALGVRADDVQSQLRSSLDYGRIDMAMVLLALLAPMLLVALLRLWWRSAPSRRADLHAAGFRDRRAQMSAFFTYPVDRGQLVFLAYSSRSERVALGALSLGLLILVTVLVGELARFDRVQEMPVALARADVVHPDRAALLAALPIANEAAEAARARLYAETAMASGNMTSARASLERARVLDPANIASQVNLALLDEQRGDATAARAALGAMDHPAARWNAARLAGLPRGEGSQTLMDLAWRDRVVAANAPNAPLWARPPTADLRAVFAGRPADGILMVARGLVGDIGPLRNMMRNAMSNQSDFAVAGLLFDASLAALLGCLALFALPLPVRTFVPRSSGVRGRRVGGIVGFIAPGWRLAGEGRAAVGVALAVAVACGIAATVAALGLGPFGAQQKVIESAGFLVGVTAKLDATVPLPMRLASAMGLIALLIHFGIELRHRRQLPKAHRD